MSPELMAQLSHPETLLKMEEELTVAESNGTIELLLTQLSEMRGEMAAIRSAQERAAEHRGEVTGWRSRVDHDIDKLAKMAGNNAEAIGSLEKRAGESRIKWGVLGFAVAVIVNSLAVFLVQRLTEGAGG